MPESTIATFTGASVGAASGQKSNAWSGVKYHCFGARRTCPAVNETSPDLPIATTPRDRPVAGTVFRSSSPVTPSARPTAPPCITTGPQVCQGDATSYGSGTEMRYGIGLLPENTSA